MHLWLSYEKGEQLGFVCYTPQLHTPEGDDGGGDAYRTPGDTLLADNLTSISSKGHASPGDDGHHCQSTD